METTWRGAMPRGSVACRNPSGDVGGSEDTRLRMTPLSTRAHEQEARMSTVTFFYRIEISGGHSGASYRYASTVVGTL